MEYIISVILILCFIISRASKFRRENGFNRILKREYYKQSKTNSNENSK